MSLKYIKGFDALRAISILLVLEGHLGTKYLLPNTSIFQNRLWYLISGDTGVSIFFVLSGFLITNILLTELARTNKINLLNFYIRRFLRLAPAILIMLIAIAILGKYGLIDFNIRSYIMAATYTYNFALLQDITSELAHIWSLAVEEQYYLLWPLTLIIFRKYNTLIFITIATIIFCLTIKFNFGNLPYIDTHPITYNDKELFIGKIFNVKRWFIPAIAPIMLGSLLAIIIHKYYNSIKDIFQANPKTLYLTIILFLSPLYLPLFIQPFFYFIQAIGIAILLGFIFYNQKWKFLNVLEYAPLRYIGRISYGLYVYHGIFRMSNDSTMWVQTHFPINIILTFITAIISYELIEKRVLKLKHRFR